MTKRLNQDVAEEGFTLFELLIVIIIIGILAAIVAFSVGSSHAGALTSSCQADAKAFETALQEYEADMGSYPGQLTTTPPLSGTRNTGSVLTTTFTSGGQSYGPLMRELPATSHYQIVTDGLGGVFVYPAVSTRVSIPLGSAAMDSPLEKVDSVLGDGDQESMNFETNPAICSDSNVVL